MGITYHRRTFKSLLTKEQIDVLERYYLINKLPIRNEKIKLSTELDIDPKLLNKWFQSKRNKERKKI